MMITNLAKAQRSSEQPYEDLSVYSHMSSQTTTILDELQPTHGSCILRSNESLLSDKDSGYPISVL
jgi:hypothetical protein